MNRKPGVIATAASVLYMLALWAWAYAWIPASARTPLGADMAGHPVRYGARSEVLMLLIIIPAVTAALGGLFVLLPLIEPRRINLTRSGRAYNAVWVVTVAVMAAIQSVNLANAMRPAMFESMRLVVGALVAVLLLVGGNYLSKTRSSFTFGIKTPWTLSSELSWTRTHRIGGRVLMLLAPMIFAAACFGVPQLVATAVVGPVVSAAALAGYSYWVWRSDPSKHTIGR